MDSLSIGAVVRLTGISADTLRTWERRYGFPTPERNESGHRRYARDEFERLVLVKGLVAQGHRPSEVIRMSDEALAQAAGQGVAPAPQPTGLTAGLRASERAQEIRLAVLLKAEKLDANGIDRLLEAAWRQLGPATTLEHVVIPLLAEVGMRWQAGRLGIHHEHLFSARMSSFLSRQWQPLSDHSSGPLIVLATPPGEEHELGLHLAAMFLALEGARILFLGQNTPSQAVLDAVLTASADAIAVSVSVVYPREQTSAYVAELLNAVAPERVLLGGAGAYGQTWPCAQLQSNHDIRPWLANFRQDIRDHGLIAARMAQSPSSLQHH